MSQSGHVIPPPPAPVVPRGRPSAKPVALPRGYFTHYSGGSRRKWEQELRNAARIGEQAEREFKRKWPRPQNREQDDEFIQEFYRHAREQRQAQHAIRMQRELQRQAEDDDAQNVQHAGLVQIIQTII